jgi:CRP-like cAMP-binding protein
MMFLKRFFAGNNLPDDVLQALYAVCEPLHVSADTIVFDQGDAVDAFYLVQQGQLVLRHNGNELKLVNSLSLTGEDAVFGQVAQHEYAAVATEATDLLRIDAHGFMALLEQYPKLASKLLKAVVQHTYAAQQAPVSASPANPHAIQGPMDFIPVFDMPLNAGFQFFTDL